MKDLNKQLKVTNDKNDELNKELNEQNNENQKQIQTLKEELQKLQGADDNSVIKNLLL